MDTLLRDWLLRIERNQTDHNETDEARFAEVFRRVGAIETQLAKLLIVVGIVNAVGGALLTVAGIIIAKKLGF